ncbi:glutamine synthetase family protein [Conexibacter sp. DBS9H8]|uniref:glutamine synthetase family protein n=1 Tax=Conexibacter sp. DBS9H8 TaxID=2937801 RepID=UPI00200BE90D|nr:glutamine synthetase family protein [Conexibacter sp. DBS9H8]
MSVHPHPAMTAPDPEAAPAHLRAEELRRTWPALTSLRVLYPDLHGIARGKDVPVQALERALASGLCFCHAVMGTDLAHTPVLGAEAGYPDMIARPDLGTLMGLPWEPGVASCLADLESTGEQPLCDPRGALRRVAADLQRRGFTAIVGPELEFFLLRPDPAGPGGWSRSVDHLSMVYTVGPQADPGGIVRQMTEQLAQAGLAVLAVNHEFMNSQYEINLGHAGALEAADRAFRLKTSVKDIAAQHGLAATFIGKPFNDQGGSGMHLHVSLDRNGENAFHDPAAPDGVSAELAAFCAGILAHAPALTALLNPTVNAYRRMQPDSLAPTHANWGFDNRATMIRIPPERGHGTRLEVRSGDGAASPYLGIAALLAAGADGLAGNLTPPPPVAGDAYRADPERIGTPLPRTLEQALDALEADTVLRASLGDPIVDTFLTLKRTECERHRAWVSEWELHEYAHHL